MFLIVNVTREDNCVRWNAMRTHLCPRQPQKAAPGRVAPGKRRLSSVVAGQMRGLCEGVIPHFQGGPDCRIQAVSSPVLSYRA